VSFFKVESVAKRFGGLTAVDNVSFEVGRGEIFGLIGPNGSGKTTIFNLISGYIKPDSGFINFKGGRIDGLKTHKICHLGIGRTFQMVKPLKRMTVLDNVMAAAYRRANTKSHAKSIAMDALNFCGLEGRADHFAGALTMGDRKRLEITRALATGPELLLLDETFAGLNPVELDDAISLVERINSSGVTIIIVEHIMKVIMSISSTIHAINFGKTMAHGAPADVAAHRGVIEAYLGDPGDAQG